MHSARSGSDRVVLLGAFSTLAAGGKAALVPSVEGDEHILRNLRADGDRVGSASSAAPGLITAAGLGVIDLQVVVMAPAFSVEVHEKRGELCQESGEVHVERTVISV